MNANIGWLFYRDYYEKALDPENVPESYFNNDNSRNKGKNNKVIDSTLPEDIVDLLKLPPDEANQSFSLKTLYPGLLIGTGYTHETGMKGEIKIGFFFDHTTGLPLLPGSSVKGILRSVFPGKAPNANQQKLREQFLQGLLREVGVADWQTLNFHKLTLLEAEIFDGIRNGEAVPLTQRDIFGDAYPSQGTTGNKLLGTDFITPHGEDLLKNPIPLQLLRILPGVTFTFQFRLTDGGLITAAQKCALFKQIILYLGVGAKTNVGYGRFEDTDMISNRARTYYTPPAHLKLLPDLPPKPQESPLPTARSAQRPVNFSDIVPATETFAPPRKSFPPEAEQSKYELIDGHYYFTGNLAPGVLLEALPSIKNPATPKQKTFRLFIGKPGQEVNVLLSYSDNSIVDKPCVVKVSLIDKKKKEVQTIEFKTRL